MQSKKAENHDHQGVHEAGCVIQSWIPFPVFWIGVRRELGEAGGCLGMALLTSPHAVGWGDGRLGIGSCEDFVRAMTVGAPRPARESQRGNLAVQGIAVSSDRFLVAG